MCLLSPIPHLSIPSEDMRPQLSHNPDPSLARPVELSAPHCSSLETGVTLVHSASLLGQPVGPVSHPPSPEAILDGRVNLAIDQSKAFTLGGPQPCALTFTEPSTQELMASDPFPTFLSLLLSVHP